MIQTVCKDDHNPVAQLSYMHWEANSASRSRRGVHSAGRALYRPVPKIQWALQGSSSDEVFVALSTSYGMPLALPTPASTGQ